MSPRRMRCCATTVSSWARRISWAPIDPTRKPGRASKRNARRKPGVFLWSMCESVEHLQSQDHREHGREDARRTVVVAAIAVVTAVAVVIAATEALAEVVVVGVLAYVVAVVTVIGILVGVGAAIVGAPSVHAVGAAGTQAFSVALADGVA